MPVLLVRRVWKGTVLFAGAVVASGLIAIALDALPVASASAPEDGPALDALPQSIDLFATWNTQGLFGAPASLEVFGPNSCAANGDPFSPTNSWRNESMPAGNPFYNMIDPPGIHTFRIAIPPDYSYNLLRVELFDAQTGNLNPSGAVPN